ncbi:hypothetical protein ACFCYN_08740 [Gottfriedia sp. NPDC056225]|uniref:hypothetical protein n=1 Tax=Gottfriedia sp. NPDC056225 TaxID=3345751 RepID=UPI00155888B2|nr:hypothetical protein HPK19_10885 [Arthrobacter citreus]
MKSRKRLVYILSILPGLGHFYLGLMSRGLQFMLLFFGTIFLTNLISSFGFFIPVIVFYSYFDALQYHSKYREDIELIDEPILNNHFKVNKFLIGWVLIGFGCLSLLENASDYISRHYNLFIDYHLVQNLIFSFVFVVLGIKLLTGKPKKEV